MSWTVSLAQNKARECPKIVKQTIQNLISSRLSSKDLKSLISQLRFTSAAYMVEVLSLSQNNEHFNLIHLNSDAVHVLRFW